MKFADKQSDRDRLSDMVVAAMETGNAAYARTVLKEHEETFPIEVAGIRREVLASYGIHL